MLMISEWESQGLNFTYISDGSEDLRIIGGSSAANEKEDQKTIDLL
jgi:hypothetical protein